CHADVTTKNEFKKKKYRNNFELVKQKLKDVEERDKIRNWQPPVTGEDIMALFEIGPGRVVGSIKSAVREAILEGEIPNSRKEALAFSLNYGKALGLSAKTDVALSFFKNYCNFNFCINEQLNDTIKHGYLQVSSDF